MRRSKAAEYLPRQALFEQDGKPVVFVRQGRSFEPREVKVLGSDRNRTSWSAICRSARKSRCAIRSLTRRRARKRRSCAATEPARDTRVSSRPEVAARHRPSGSAARSRQPPRPQAALAADDARHDLRRRGRRRDAVDRRGRAAAGDGVHRAVGRAQRHRRGARDDRASGVPQGAAARRPASPFRTSASSARRWRVSAPRRRASAFSPRRCCRSRSATCRPSTASLRRISRSETCASPRGRFFDDGETSAPRRSRCSAKAPRRRCSARRSGRPVHQSERSVAAGDWRRGAAAQRAD